jgi:hypothetical protein
MPLRRLQSVIFVLVAVAGTASSKDALTVDLCRVIEAPNKYANTEISVRAILKSSMHGTYLGQSGCDGVLFIALPSEIAKGTTEEQRVEKDANFKAFERARADFRSDAPNFTATFSGRLEYTKHGKGFGYYGKNKARLVLFKVAEIEQRQ